MVVKHGVTNDDMYNWKNCVNTHAVIVIVYLEENGIWHDDINIINNDTHKHTPY